MTYKHCGFEISDVIFSIDVDEMIHHYLAKRMALSQSSKYASPNVRITCKQVRSLVFNREKFADDQEPDLTDDKMYREIIDCGIFTYIRTDKHLMVNYVEDDNYPFDSYEVIADTILQFVYLIMIDYHVLPIHASVLSFKDQAILIMGNSGVGKTTLELALLNEGLSFFSDDVAFIGQEMDIYNSNESIISCSPNTAAIIQQLYKRDLTQLKLAPPMVQESWHACKKEMHDKFTISATAFMHSNSKKTRPCLILFPQVVQGNQYEITDMTGMEALSNIISLTISEKFSTSEKQLYFRRLKQLIECSRPLRLLRGTEGNIADLKLACGQIMDIISGLTEDV